jgi:hypothetical protein
MQKVSPHKGREMELPVSATLRLELEKLAGASIDSHRTAY